MNWGENNRVDHFAVCHSAGCYTHANPVNPVIVSSTSYVYDQYGRQIEIIDVLNQSTYTVYDLRGNVIRQYGATYPVWYEYDVEGRMTAMATTRDTTLDPATVDTLDHPSLDVTRWSYDPATGLLLQKLYDDGKGPSYTYTPDGKPRRTTWARGEWKESAYDPQRRLAGVSCSDATPSASFGYDAFSRLSSASNAVASYAYAFSLLGITTNETVSISGDEHVLARELDAWQRLHALAVDGKDLAIYSYDADNRISAVSNASFVAEYHYTPDGYDAGYSVMLTNGIVLNRVVSRDFWRRNLIALVSNDVDSVALSTYQYGYDELSRATARNADTFGYNSRSEVTNATLNAMDYTYAYDDIGNHTSSSANSVSTIYDANALNQYSEISVPSVPSVDNLSYDRDGNLLTNDVWSYTWDAENRLVAAYSNTVCVVSNAYDHMSRRVVKVSHGGTETRRFVYDGWNLVQETIENQQSALTNRHVWGKDLSGTLQGAGGVGGLLAISLNDSWYFPLTDANGNITTYVNEQGAIVAEYVYDAFGGTIAQSGAMSDAFPHRFSTKYLDSETGLYYYGYRFYNPILHRWLNRDPIAEDGGLNLYGFCGNDGVNQVDVLGRRIWVVDGNMGYADLIKSWNAALDMERKRIRAYIDALPADSKYKFYWYFKTSPGGTWNVDKNIARQEFIRRMDSEVVVHVPTQFISLSQDRRLIRATVDGHINKWDATGYAHHTSELNEADYRNERVPRESVKRVMDTIKPNVGYFVYSSCVGDGVGKGWLETQQLAEVLYKPVASPEKCRVIWYAAYLKNIEVKASEQIGN